MKRPYIAVPPRHSFENVDHIANVMDERARRAYLRSREVQDEQKETI